jgi:pimeloyl-ACP methyl ester carboxylesterase
LIDSILEPPSNRMNRFLLSQKRRIHYHLLGKGECVVLLHGYLETLEIWSDFANELSKSYQVLTIDLPGHGRSEVLSDCDSVERMATCVREILNHHEISKAVIVGHSMGGYVALAFAELFPDHTAGFCLFHSTPYPDSDQKKLSRNVEIERMNNGEKVSIIDGSIPLRFATGNLMKLQKEVDWAKLIASDISDNGVMLALKAMLVRPDRNHVIRNAIYPTMMIFGTLDNHIPLSVAIELADRHKKTRTVYLNNSGHMGFIEEKNQALVAIKIFLECVFS